MAFGSRVLSSSASFDPYWWRAAPHEAGAAPALPQRTDVAIIGSGITGLVAAIDLARGGRQVTVFEAQEPGHGASTRNAGYVGRTLKHGFGEIMEAQGLDQAKRIYGELMEAFIAVKETVEQEKIACHYRQQGRLLLATSTAMYDAMAREFALRERHLGEPFAMVDRAGQRAEIGSDHYFGGVKIEDHAGLHPGLYHQGLLDAARDAGVTVCAFSPVAGFAKTDDGFTLFVRGQKIAARELIVATNGYSGAGLAVAAAAHHAVRCLSDGVGTLGRRTGAAIAAGRPHLHRLEFQCRLDAAGAGRSHPHHLRRTDGRAQCRSRASWRNGCTCGCCGCFRISPTCSSTMCGRANAAAPSTSRRASAAMTACTMPAAIASPGCRWARCSARNWRSGFLDRQGGESAFDTPVPAKFFYTGNPWFVPYAHPLDEPGGQVVPALTSSCRRSAPASRLLGYERRKCGTLSLGTSPGMTELLAAISPRPSPASRSSRRSRAAWRGRGARRLRRRRGSRWRRQRSIA